MTFLVVEAINKDRSDSLSLVREFAQEAPVRGIFPTPPLPIIHGICGKEIECLQRSRVMCDDDQDIWVRVELFQCSSGVSRRLRVSIPTTGP